MAWWKSDTDDDNAELRAERNKLKREVETLEKKVRGLEHESKLADEDIKHMVRVREEQLALDYDRKVVELERKTQDEIAKAKDTYRDKLEVRLQAEVDNIKEMYGEILGRLPKVTVRQMDSRHEDVGGNG